jgi:hypothetical protein
LTPRQQQQQQQQKQQQQQQQQESNSRKDEKIVESAEMEMERISKKLTRCFHEENNEEDGSTTRIRLNYISSELPKIREEDSEEIRDLFSDDNDSESTDLNDKTISKCLNEKIISSCSQDKKANSACNVKNISNSTNDKTVINGSNNKMATNGSNEKNASNGFLDQKINSNVVVSGAPNAFQHFVCPSNFTDEEKETFSVEKRN